MRRLLCPLLLALVPSAAFSAPLLDTFDGHPGGCLDVNDTAVGLMNYALAPNRWLGDWSALGAGDTLSVDVFEQLLSGSYNVPAEMFVLQGPGGRATALVNPTPANNAWTNFAVSLAPGDWTVTAGTWDALLADVQMVQISAEFVNGDEETRLDNIYLSEAPAPVSRVCILSLLDAGSEDWLIQNSGQITIASSGGDGGGYLQVPDATGITYAYAGTRFRGDWRPFEGLGKVGVSLRQLAGTATPLGPVPLIRLSGPGGSAEPDGWNPPSHGPIPLW